MGWDEISGTTQAGKFSSVMVVLKATSGKARLG